MGGVIMSANVNDRPARELYYSPFQVRGMRRVYIRWRLTHPFPGVMMLSDGGEPVAATATVATPLAERRGCRRRLSDVLVQPRERHVGMRAAAVDGRSQGRHGLRWWGAGEEKQGRVCRGTLKGDMGFDGAWLCSGHSRRPSPLYSLLLRAGYVMSDWTATHSTIPAALAGLDQEMPETQFFGAPLAAAVANGSVPMSRIDDMVTRMLTPMYALNIFANGNSPDRNTSSPANSTAHDALALQLAQASITLVANKGLLPVATEQIRSVAVFGDEVGARDVPWTLVHRWILESQGQPTTSCLVCRPQCE